MTTNEDYNKKTYLKDYKPPPFLIPQVSILFELNKQNTKVVSTLHIEKETFTTQITLNGSKELLLESISIDGKLLNDDTYKITNNYDLIIDKLSSNTKVIIIITNYLSPIQNTALEGLYYSQSIFCTQNEPEGFRKITYFLDRPDILSIYTIQLIADKKGNPVLLSNGNLIETKQINELQHSATWHDPYPKPSYLFALVSGDLACLENSFQTKSGKNILLQIYCKHGKTSQCNIAMQALKQSMKWDEEIYNFEYDLQRFMIVAIPDFNSGAMENKGLNIFNDKYILANEEIATDELLENIASIVAHEYFHNYTGNRITCRDWFQLTLKEGLTIFRDQSFSQDSIDYDSKRIEDVEHLKMYQFPEDASELAHPIQPQEYLEINNFYTSTVYEKGAEVIRMMYTMLGKEAYFKGIQNYFNKHDGTAATVDNFIDALQEDAPKPINLHKMQTWYTQKGTPHILWEHQYNANTQEYQITFKQQLNQYEQARYLPIVFSLFDTILKKEIDLQQYINKVFHLITTKEQKNHEAIFLLENIEHSFTFSNIKNSIIPSLLKNFSAPVIIGPPLNHYDSITLFRYENNPFQKWFHKQNLVEILLQEKLHPSNSKPNTIEMEYFTSLEYIFNTPFSHRIKSRLLEIPNEKYISSLGKNINYTIVPDIRKSLLKNISQQLKEPFIKEFTTLLEQEKRERNLAQMVGIRKLKFVLLEYLIIQQPQQYLTYCFELLETTSNMTETIQTLKLILKYESNQQKKQHVLDQFYDKWKSNDQVILYYITIYIQYFCTRIEQVQELTQDSMFTWSNPNKVYALTSGLVNNIQLFHHPNTEGYQFMFLQIIKLDKKNSRMASNLLKVFLKMHNANQEIKESIAQASLKVSFKQHLFSKDTYEIFQAFEKMYFNSELK